MRLSAPVRFDTCAAVPAKTVTKMPMAERMPLPMRPRRRPVVLGVEVPMVVVLVGLG